jgi:monoamine oxidase
MRPSTLLILACAAALALGTSAAPTAVVIGAGVAGLKAAADLAAKGVAVTVLEGRDRVGGRVWTVNTPGGPLELGAQWVRAGAGQGRDCTRRFTLDDIRL